MTLKNITFSAIFKLGLMKGYIRFRDHQQMNFLLTYVVGKSKAPITH